MNILLDTHAFIWWLSGSRHLSHEASKVIADRRNTIFVSAASAWEITTKHRLGKLPGVAAIVNDLSSEIAAEGFREIDIAFRHACVAGSLKGGHRDPFDRMLVAQALLEKLVLVSNESLFENFGIQRLW